MKNVNAIVAVDENGGIGYKNQLPWPMNRRDMQWFRLNTEGHVVVMGRNTWESLGCKKLKNRINVVITRKDNLVGDHDGLYSGDIKTILENLVSKYPDLKIWAIGGFDLYEQALPYCDELYISTISGVYEHDRELTKEMLSEFTDSRYLEQSEDLTIEIRTRG